MSKCPKNVITVEQAIEKIRGAFDLCGVGECWVERFSIETVKPNGGTLKITWDCSKVDPSHEIKDTTDKSKPALRWLIAAHSQRQFDAFCKSQHIASWRAIRVQQEQDVRGWHNPTPMLLLPGYNTNPGTLAAVKQWQSHGGRLRPVPERYVGENGAAEEMSCPNDTDGDGDCHLCVGGGCRWRPT